MQEIIGVFFIGSLLILVLMGALTRSLAGALLGLAVVYLGGALLLANQGGLFLLGAIGVGMIGILCLLLAFGLGFNYSRSFMTHQSPSGDRWDASQITIGEGAKNSHNWNIPKSLPSGESNQLIRYDD